MGRLWLGCLGRAALARAVTSCCRYLFALLKSNNDSNGNVDSNQLLSSLRWELASSCFSYPGDHNSTIQTFAANLGTGGGSLGRGSWRVLDMGAAGRGV